MLASVWGVESERLVTALSAAAFGGLILSLVAARAQDRDVDSHSPIRGGNRGRGNRPPVTAANRHTAADVATRRP